jgi:hypothetical protein
VDQPAVKVHFVVGMPRAGTTFVVQRLNEHPAIAAFGESRFWGNDWIEPDDGDAYGASGLAQVRAKLVANPLDTNVGELGPEPDRSGWMNHLGRPELAALVADTIDGISPPADPGTVFVAYASAIAGAEGKQVAVEKTPHHVRHVDRIRRHLPDARFVIMIRGPEEFLLSYKHKGDTKPDEIRARAELRWQSVGVSLLWRSYLRHSSAAAERLGEAGLLVRNEDLDADPAGVLDAIQRHLGVDVVDLAGPCADEAAARANSSFAGDRPRLAPAEQEWCRRLAGRDAEAAGYGIEPVQASVAAMAREGVGVVPWAVRNALDSPRWLEGSIVSYARRAVLRRP